jgi:hypothetical protein
MAASCAVFALIVVTIVGAIHMVGGGDDATALTTAPPLIAHGECGGLSVSASLPGHPGRWPIQADNQSEPIVMPTDALMWLRANGPCVGRLRISASNDFVQTATRGVTSFNAQRIGIIVSNGNPGDATIGLFLACRADPLCPATRIATIPVTVSARSPGVTESPSASP